MPCWKINKIITKKRHLQMSYTLKALLLLIGIAVMGCSPSVRSVKSPVSLPESFSSTGHEPLPDKWWKSFNDPQLNDLIQEALENNFTIRATWDRLRQAEQVAIKTGAALLPDVNLRANASRTRQETGQAISYNSHYVTGLSLSYEIDLWGAVWSSQQAALLDAQAAEENVYTAAITLSASIARRWYQLAEAKQKIALLNQQMETNRKVLEIITTKFRKGQVSAADVYRQSQLVASTQGRLILARGTIRSLQQQLAVLIGKKPDALWDDAPLQLVKLPVLPKTGVPSSLLQRRPDVQSAFRAIQAADRRAAIAVADQYPALSISSTLETSAGKVHDLFDNWLVNLAGNAVGPLFDAGRRKAEVKRQQAVLSERINQYGQKILEAIKETEDALDQECYQKEYVDNLNKQLQFARQVAERTKQSYVKGTLDYLRVLDALVSQQQLEITELAARRILLERRIDLCKAIAGRWELPQPKPATLFE